MPNDNNPEKTLTEQQEEEIAKLQGKLDGYETTLNGLYEAIEKILKEKEKTEKELKELQEQNTTDTQAKEDAEKAVLQELQKTNEKTKTLDAKILSIQNLLKPKTN